MARNARTEISGQNTRFYVLSPHSANRFVITRKLLPNIHHLLSKPGWSLKNCKSLILVVKKYYTY